MIFTEKQRQQSNGEGGQSLIEYSLLIVLISLIAIPSTTSMGTAVARILCDLKTGEHTSEGEYNGTWNQWGFTWNPTTQTCDINPYFNSPNEPPDPCQTPLGPFLPQCQG